MNNEKLLATIGHFGQTVNTAMTARSAAEANALIESMTVEFRNTLAALELPGNTAEGENPFDYITAALEEISNQINALQGADETLDASLTGLADTLRGELETRLNELVDGSPAAMDTLRELSAALGDDADFAATLTTTLAGKADKSALGTAAAANRQTGQSDATANRLMIVGAFGLGQPINLSNPNLDDYLPPGNYYCNSPINGPGGNGYLRVEGGSADYFQQSFRSVISGKSYTRQINAGVRESWRPDYTSANIVGLVNQVGGVPTGAIIESGTNDNGSYTRYADGTQICIGRLWVNALNLQVGGISPPYGWTFPAVFGPGNVSAHVTNQSGWVYEYVIGYEGLTASYMSSIYIKNVGTALRTQNHILHLTAIGRWY